VIILFNLWTVWPRIPIGRILEWGCSFHLTQSFYRNIKAIGLSLAYRKDSQTRNICRELLGLYLLPAEKIRKRFQTIASNATGLMLRSCNNVETTYINSTIWPPECWSMCMQHVGTNNNFEGTHNNLKSVAGKLSILLIIFYFLTVFLY
jgi:hypothetical protein